MFLMLTHSEQTISPEMKDLLASLRERVVMGFVGGSDLSKQKEQLGENGDSLIGLSSCNASHMNGLLETSH